MPSMWFVVPASGRAQLARICLKQLRRTCDTLTDNGIDATAVVIADDENLDTARELGFGTVLRDNEFVSRKFNDGIEMALARPLPQPPREPTHGEYLVSGRREYRGNKPGSTFTAKLERNAERRAVTRGDIQFLRRLTPSLVEGSYTFPDGWDPARAADYVVPCGSDDWVHPDLFADLPDTSTLVGFKHISFVREDGAEMQTKCLTNDGGCGIRIYPRQMLRHVSYRPADEDRVRACDTSILTNVRQTRPVSISHPVTDPRLIVDWKTYGEQLNPWDSLRRHPGKDAGDPFERLADVWPAEALEEMAAHYGRVPVAA